ncbi:MAG: hypothetical protein HY287_02790 [Planctomycetes bacterium]|nr:hypothetical protein [Planctomycetota bacterium]MBI3833238.1 hypothetical protein [Planctomycetota bacterium]
MRSPSSLGIALVCLGLALFGVALPVCAAQANTGGCSSVVHVQDFSKFQVCFGYPATAPPGVDCDLFNFDGNGVVDLKDYAQRTFVLRARILVFPTANLQDFSRFQICFAYPVKGQSGVDCVLFDFDGNGVVDLRDFAGRSFVLRSRLPVFPAQALMTYSQQIDFDAAILESGAHTVNWSVQPLPGSEPGESLGTIDANGLYSPPSPSDLHAASEVLIKATSDGAALASEFACVTLFGTLAARSPVSLVLPGSGDSGGNPTSVTTALPLVALVLLGHGDLSGSPPNVTVAQPPTSVVLPGQGDLDELPMNVTLAMPPVALVLPGAGELDLAINVTLAMPPVALVLPAAGDTDTFSPNTTVANPPITVDFADSP